MRNLSSSSSRSKTVQPLKIFPWIRSLHIKSRPSANILNSHKIFLLCYSHLLLGSLLPPLGPMKKAFLHWPLTSSSQPRFSFMLRLRGPFLISPMFRGIMSYTRLIWHKHKSQNIFQDTISICGPTLERTHCGSNVSSVMERYSSGSHGPCWPSS